MKKPYILSVLLLWSSTALAGQWESAPVVALPGSGAPTPSADARSLLARSPHGVRLRVDTDTLEPGHAYSVWVVAYNRPQFCGNPYECDVPDLPIVPGHDPRVEASIVGVTGAVVGANGVASFVGSVHEPLRGNNGTEVLFGPGLTNAQSAEIHVIIRSHGLASQDLVTLFESISTYAGGCDPACEDQQVAVHRVQQ